MKYGLMLPNKGNAYGEPAVQLELAQLAEEAGWEGYFLWDHIGGGGISPVLDPMVCLGAIASHTHSMRLGTMVTPLSRRRPWKVARELVTLDYLSKGRIVLGVGLGDMVNKDFNAFGEESRPRVRAAMLDESLEIITGLLTGKPFQFSGEHYQVLDSLFQPPALQKPRIPVWVAAKWPFKRPLRRAARWDGVLPYQWNAGPITPDVIRKIRELIFSKRTLETPFDIIKYGITEGKDLAADRAKVEEYIQAGATWWVEDISSSRGPLSKVKKRIAAGLPR